jgi:hypothetical protein
LLKVGSIRETFFPSPRFFFPRLLRLFISLIVYLYSYSSAEFVYPFGMLPAMYRQRANQTTKYRTGGKKMATIAIEDLNQEQTITNEGMKMVYGGMRTYSLFSRSEDRVCYLSYDDSNPEDVGELLCYDLPEK